MRFAQSSTHASTMNKAISFESPAGVHHAVGQEVCVTDWVTICQDRIDKFAEATGDFQWIHVDVARARAESPYGGTIAHGFLTLSLLGKFYEDYLTVAMPFYDMGLNYGLNKVRFTQPVPSGSRVRGRFVLAMVDDIKNGLQLTFTVTIDIEGVERPACVAESVVRRHSSDASNATISGSSSQAATS
jgi:acyl dehydratase